MQIKIFNRWRCYCWARWRGGGWARRDHSTVQLLDTPSPHLLRQEILPCSREVSSAPSAGGAQEYGDDQTEDLRDSIQEGKCQSELILWFSIHTVCDNIEEKLWGNFFFCKLNIKLLCPVNRWIVFFIYGLKSSKKIWTLNN